MNSSYFIGQVVSSVNKFDKSHYFFWLECSHKKGSDKIKVVISNDYKKIAQMFENILVIGQIKSYNDEKTNKLSIYVYANHIQFSKEKHCNFLLITGNVCTKPKIEKSGRAFCIMKADDKYYIPVVGRGDASKKIKTFFVGEKISIYGHLQSRVHEKGTCYEIVSSLFF